MKISKRIWFYVWILLLSVMLVACGASGSNRDSANTAAADMDAGAQEAPAAASSETLFDQASTVNTKSAETAGQGGELSGADQANVSVPEAGSSGQAVGFTGADIAAGLNKKLIYKANLNMEVKDYGKAQSEVRNLVTLAKGYIIQFNEDMSEYGQGGTFVIKVPASGLSSFLNNLEKVEHEKWQRSIEGQDVSEEYVDLESRLKAKQLMEEQYIGFMKKATTSRDLVEFANQLGSIQESIEQIKGRMRYIDQNVALSTVELRLYESDSSLSQKIKTDQGPLLERASSALKGSWSALSVFFQWLFIALAAALPILAIAAVAGGIWLGLRQYARRRGEGESSGRLLRESQPPVKPEAEEAGDKTE